MERWVFDDPSMTLIDIYYAISPDDDRERSYRDDRGPPPSRCTFKPPPPFFFLFPSRTLAHTHPRSYQQTMTVVMTLETLETPDLPQVVAVVRTMITVLLLLVMEVTMSGGLQGMIGHRGMIGTKRGRDTEYGE
jgi:hypothetical protein